LDKKLTGKKSGVGYKRQQAITMPFFYNPATVYLGGKAMPICLPDVTNTSREVQIFGLL